MSYSKLLELVERGQKGDYPWIPLGQPKIGRHVGIGKRLYHLVGGDPGTGKTAFVDQNYVLNAYDWYINDKPEEDETKLKIIYFSMERSKENKLAKWAALKLWEEEGIILDVPTVLGWGTAKRKLTDFEKRKLKEYEDFFDGKMLKDVHILDGATNPTGVYKQLVDWGLRNGNEYRRDEHGNVYRKDRQKYLNNQECWEKIRESDLPNDVEVKRYESVYKPDDEKLVTLVVLDHMGVVNHESGLGDKGTLDKMSKYFQACRDYYGYCFVAINQFNRNNANIMRRVNTDMSPEKQDFKGSGNMYEDADVVLALFNPYEFGISPYLQYKVKDLVNDEGYNRFRSVTILKNTYGIDNAAFGLQFIGECGYYNELPKASDMTSQMYDEIVYPNGIAN